MFDNYEANLARDKMQSTDTAIVVWLGGSIPEQATLEVIEHTLLESKEFQRYKIDQEELLNKRIILKLGKQIRRDKIVSAIHVVVPEDKTNIR